MPSLNQRLGHFRKQSTGVRVLRCLYQANMSLPLVAIHNRMGAAGPMGAGGTVYKALYNLQHGGYVSRNMCTTGQWRNQPLFTITDAGIDIVNFFDGAPLETLHHSEPDDMPQQTLVTCQCNADVDVPPAAVPSIFSLGDRIAAECAGERA